MQVIKLHCLTPFKFTQSFFVKQQRGKASKVKALIKFSCRMSHQYTLKSISNQFKSYLSDSWFNMFLVQNEKEAMDFQFR